MGRANQQLQSFKVEPYVQAMMQANAAKMEGGRATMQGMMAAGQGIQAGLLTMGQKKERSKDRALQRELQDKNQRLGWARLQFDKQATLLNQLDDDLARATTRFDEESALLHGDFGGTPEGVAEAEMAMKKIQSQREQVKAGVYGTARMAGLEITGMENVEAYLGGQGGASFTVTDQYADSTKCKGPT